MPTMTKQHPRKSGFRAKSQRVRQLSLPPRDPRDKPVKNFSVSLPKWLVDRVDAIGGELYSRNEVVREILKSYFAEEDADQLSQPEPVAPVTRKSR